MRSMAALTRAMYKAYAACFNGTPWLKAMRNASTAGVEKMIILLVQRTKSSFVNSNFCDTDVTPIGDMLMNNIGMLSHTPSNKIY